MNAISEAEKTRRILEIRRLCGNERRPSESRLVLRTDAWRPRALSSIGTDRADQDRHRLRAEEVERVAAMRRAGIQRDPRLRDEPGPSLDGRILAYVPDWELADGAAASASDGLYTIENEPPWDAWIRYDESTGVLFSWIPATLIPLAQAGIDVNPEECIYWSDG